jgi:hypothetical protein
MQPKLSLWHNLYGSINFSFVALKGQNRPTPRFIGMDWRKPKSKALKGRNKLALVYNRGGSI